MTQYAMQLQIVHDDLSASTQELSAADCASDAAQQPENPTTARTNGIPAP
jgi:hypothetical protein